MPKPKDGAARQADYRSRGRQIAMVLTDPKAIATLERLEKREGGVKAAVTAALHAAASKATGSKPPH